MVSSGPIFEVPGAGDQRFVTADIQLTPANLPESLWLGGCLMVLVCTLILVVRITWGAGRINKNEPRGSKTKLQPTAQA